MHLDKNKFAGAAGLTMGLAFLVCAAFVALWPDFSLRLLGWLMHLVNVEKFAGDVAITWPGVIFGFLQSFIYTYLGAWVFAWLHNRFMRG